MKRSLGFTLIELLTVIAIIAILSAIIFPVYARAKDSANRSSDITSLNSIRTALQLYRVDQGGYPPALLGYINRYQSGPEAGNVIPANLISGYLYPKRVDNISTFTPVVLRENNRASTTAVWPNQDPRNVGTAPVADLNGDGNKTPADDPAGARQAYGPNTVVASDPRNPVAASNPALEYYRISGYDVAAVKQPGGQRYELRYTLFWSTWGITGGNASDDPRQLGYSDPPDDTLVTWNSYYRDYDGANAVQRNKRDVALFLGGAARVYDSKDLSDRSWRVTP